MVIANNINAKNLDRIVTLNTHYGNTYKFNTGNLVSNYIINSSPSVPTDGQDVNTYFEFDLHSTEYDGCVINLYFAYGNGFFLKLKNGWQLNIGATNVNYYNCTFLGADGNETTSYGMYSLIKLVLDVTNKIAYIANVDGCVKYRRDTW